MKSLLAILIFAGVAWCNSTQYYGWTPNKELVYRFESQVLTGIPEIRQSQYAGVRLSSEVRVQAFPDYSLRVQFENSRFVTVNGEMNLSDKGRIVKGSETEQNAQKTEIPSNLRKYLEKPFLVHMKRGLVQSFFVEASEPHSISNIKRSFLSQIQLDLTASRRNEIESNHIPEERLEGLEDPEADIPLESTNRVTYFTTNEETLLGDCQTSYTIHPLPKYRALELEQEWKEEEKELFEEQKKQSRGQDVCEGKEYFRIQKTKNLDNCKRRPLYQKFVGVESKLDGSKSAWTDSYTHLVSSTYVVCGDLNKFVIRKALKKDIVSMNPMGWNTEENIKRSVTISMELLKEETSFRPMDIPSDHKEKKSLIFEFPEANRQLNNNGQVDKEAQEYGIQAVLAQPDLKSAPKMLFTTGINKHEITRQIVDELRRVASEVFESPESCSSTGDAAGYLAAISKYLLPLDYEELKSIKDQVLSAGSQSQESQKVLKNLFFDVLSTVGTNPATMLIKQEIESKQITGLEAINALQGAFLAIRTPTEELLKELVQLVKGLKKFAQEEQDMLDTGRSLYSLGMIQMSNLLYRACVNPARKNLEFPVRIFGQFCSNESSVITQEWIPYLEQELENPLSKHSDDEHFRLVAISSLGKLGHIKALHPLIKAIEGSLSTRPMVRSVAVYSLKRVARMNPVLIRPVLLALIDNPAENTQVRIAAVAILPWAQPSMAQLQKVAVRTWFEPSKQVSSFIYSTFKNLASTQVPELKPVGLKVKSVIQMIKPQEYGLQYSQNVNFGQFVDYLKSSISKKVSWVFNGEDMLPTKVAYSNKVFNSAVTIRGLSFSVYTQGMDQLLEKILYFPNHKDTVSSAVKEQLEKITRELKTEMPKEKSPMAYIQTRILGGERVLTLNKEYISELIQGVTESIRRNPQLFTEGKHFELTRSFQAVDAQTLSATSAGFLTYTENILPVVYSVKGFFKGSNLIDSAIPIPTKVVAKIMPVVNAKLHSHVGILSPFNDQLIGAGVDAALHIATPLEAEVEVNNMNQVSVVLKTPESIKKPFELIHVYINPYTVKKNLKTVKPISKSAQMKSVLSNAPMKKYEIDFGKKLGVSSKLQAESDAQYVDLYSYWEKLRQHSPATVSQMALLPGSIRKSSFKIVYNPSESETKEFNVRFNLAQGKRSVESDMEAQEELNFSDEKLIKNICKEFYQTGSHELNRCEQHLNNFEEVAREDETNICDALQGQLRNECQRSSRICEKAQKICVSHHGPQSNKCMDKYEDCQMNILNGHKMKQVLREMGQNSQAHRMHINAALQGRSRNSLQWTVSYALAKEEQGRVIKTLLGVEVESEKKYEVTLETKTVLPKINHQWNTEKLIEEEMKMEVDGKLKYGRQDNQKEISFKSVIEKSQEQKQSVRSSPEYVRCAEKERKNNALSAVCMKVRNQAAALDKIWLKVNLPEELRRQPVLLKAEELVKAYFLSQVSVHQDSSIQSQGEYQIQLDVSRAGDEAQLKVEKPGQKWIVKNIRLPQVFKGLAPISVRNSIYERIVQKLTRNQAPASCTVEPESINTFDNKTYRYEMNDCMHVLFKDASDKIPVAVLARSQSASEPSKIIEILAGVSKMVLKPKSRGQQPQGLDIELKVHEEKKTVELREGERQVVKSESGRVVVEMKRYNDNVYRFWFKNEYLQVITDGVRIEIIAPQLARGRSLGVCGDFNGENTADLKTPKQCILHKERFAAYSYILDKETGSSSQNEVCSGIPSQDREEYRQKSEECVKQREIPTRLEDIYQRLYQLAQPTISVHLVEKQTGQLCISREKVKICARKTLQKEVATTYLEGIKPVQVKARLVEYSCVDLPSQKAFSLERRAKGGDNLQAELSRLPVHFTRTEYEPVLCKPQKTVNEQDQD